MKFPHSKKTFINLYTEKNSKKYCKESLRGELINIGVGSDVCDLE